MQLSIVVRQLRTLQPKAPILGPYPRTNATAKQDAMTRGVDGIIFKPFDPAELDEVLLKYFDDIDLVSLDDNVVQIRAFRGTEDRLDRYLQRVQSAIEEAIGKVSEACFDDAVIDLTSLPIRADRLPRILLAAEARCKKMRVRLVLVGPDEAKKLAQTYSETAVVPFFATVKEAIA